MKMVERSHQVRFTATIREDLLRSAFERSCDEHLMGTGRETHMAPSVSRFALTNEQITEPRRDR
jgi:hypothetical protein